MSSRVYGVDTAAYQPTSLAAYHAAGAKYVIVKLTEGLSYFNPKAKYQIKSAHAHHMYVDGYHFAVFGSSVRQAKKEAKFAVKRAKKLGLAKGRWLFCDWETGDGNWVYGGKVASARAIMAFMAVVKKAGYKPGIYSGASLLRNNIDTARIVHKYATCIWVASYATMSPVSTANFGYFPSMDGVAVWQFTSDWKGMSVDANISLIDLHKHTAVHTKSKSDSLGQKKAKNVRRVPAIVYAPVIKNDPNWSINLRDSKGHATSKYIRTNTQWRVIKVGKIKGVKYYCLGTDKQWVPADLLKVVKYK